MTSQAPISKIHCFLSANQKRVREFHVHVIINLLIKWHVHLSTENPLHSWLAMDTRAREKHLKHMKICILAPVLFGKKMNYSSKVKSINFITCSIKQINNASVNSSSAHPPPPPANPRALAFFLKNWANSPRWGRKKRANALPPGLSPSYAFAVFY